jgi:hypothetical protein
MDEEEGVGGLSVCVVVWLSGTYMHVRCHSHLVASHGVTVWRIHACALFMTSHGRGRGHQVA